MPFAIMRCAKLKSSANLASSLKHNYRERETPNADSEKTHGNVHAFADNTNAAMGNWRARMPEKRRKDAVVAVEYMMTASPEWFKKASPDEIDMFFNDCLEWIQDKYGKENIIACSVHLDEKTPHMATYVTPITKDGRLSAKEFIGDKKKMSADQDSFHAKVAKLGLERGIKGSKAKHKTIRQFYAEINKATEQVNIKPHDLEPKVIKKGFFSTTYETNEGVAKRLNEYIRPMQEQATLFRDVAARLMREQNSHERTRKERDTFKEELNKNLRMLKANEKMVEKLAEFMPPEQMQKAINSLREETEQQERAKAERRQKALDRKGKDKDRGFSR